MDLTDKQRNHLARLTDLLVYGHNQLSKVGLKRKHISLRKELLFFMFGATQSYSESILKIITPTQNHASIYANSGLILFRSITENLINLSWIYACDSQKNAAIFYIHWLQSTLTYSNKYKALMIKYSKNKYPTWGLTFGDKKKAEDWDEYIVLLKNDIKKLQKRHKLPSDSQLPLIEQRCMQHDDYLKAKGKLNYGNCLEKLYITYYPYFSGIAHLTVQGLDTFRNPLTDDMEIDSHPKEIEALVPVTYCLYFALLEMFLKQFGGYDKIEMKEYRKISKLILINTDTSYEELKNLTDAYYAGTMKINRQEILDLLNKYAIKVRQDDGVLDNITISIPKTVADGIVVGLRYIKRNNTKTEDLFLFSKGKPIEKGYKGKLEKKLIEYKGTHKLQRL